MSCTHDCGCTQTVKDARTDEWVQIAPEINSSPGGWTGKASSATLPWRDARIVRVLTEDKPTQEPVLPRQIEPEDVRPGMVIETRTAWEVTSRIVNGRFKAVESSGGVNMGRRCEVWLIEDAPAPVDPDASDRQCAWADYRKDYGVGEPEMVAAHKAFMAGWKAAREGDQSGPLR